MRRGIGATRHAADDAKPQPREFRGEFPGDILTVQRRAARADNGHTRTIHIVVAFPIQPDRGIVSLLQHGRKGFIRLRDKADTRGFHPLDLFRKIKMSRPIRQHRDRLIANAFNLGEFFPLARKHSDRISFKSLEQTAQHDGADVL